MDLCLELSTDKLYTHPFLPITQYQVLLQTKSFFTCLLFNFSSGKAFALGHLKHKCGNVRHLEHKSSTRNERRWRRKTWENRTEMRTKKKEETAEER